METIESLGVFLALFLGALVLSKRDRRLHDVVLAAWLVLIALHLLVFCLEQTQRLTASIWSSANAAFPLLQGPFLYAYTRLRLGESRLRSSFFVHAIPFVLFWGALAVFEDAMRFPWVAAVIVSGTTYLLLCWQRLAAARAQSPAGHHQWLRILVVGLSAVWVAFIMLGMLIQIAGMDSFGHQAISAAVTVFVLGIGFFGLREGHFLEHGDGAARYRSSPLSRNDLGRIKQKLDASMREQQYFLDPELSIAQLASQTKISAHHLSQLFNHELGSGYYDYVNGFRVDAVKRALESGTRPGRSLLQLAHDCGFNSKSTFNRAFKKNTGVTPSQFLSLGKETGSG